MTNYKNNNFVIVMIVAFLYVVISLLIYNFFFLDYNMQDEKKESLFVDVIDENTINDMLEIINKNNLYILGTYEKDIDNINALESNEKVNIAYKTLVTHDYNNISSSSISEFFKNAFSATIYWNKNDIYCDCGNILYLYDKELDSYIYNENHLGHGLLNIMPYYTKVLNVKKKNDLYVITVNYIWNNNTDYFGYTNTGYSSYQDALNMNNSLFEIEVSDDLSLDVSINSFAVEEIEKNFDLYKEKLHKYIYTFKKENDNYLLVSFKYEK